MNTRRKPHGTDNRTFRITDVRTPLVSHLMGQPRFWYAEIRERGKRDQKGAQAGRVLRRSQLAASASHSTIHSRSPGRFSPSSPDRGLWSKVLGDESAMNTSVSPERLIQRTARKSRSPQFV